MTPRRFRDIVRAHYGAQGRHALPWRKTKDPYRILVSEVMLQQTQVERVIPYYTAFLKKFPNAKALAAAPLSEVLMLWQGLGYNRRAKMLHEAAKVVTERYAGKMPSTVEQLLELPGVGPYTARAVAVFAANIDVVFVETNLRTAVIYHFFPGEAEVTDAEVMSILEKTLPVAREVMSAREWYSALMDYGSYLKRSGIRTNARIKGYVKQSRFDGSRRQARGAILKALIGTSRRADFLIDLLGPERRGQMRAQVAALTKEGLIELYRGSFRLPG